MHVTDVTLGVYKQNLNAGLLQQHHFWAGLMAIFRVAVLLFIPGTGGYFGVKRIGMTVGNPRKLP